MKVSAQNFEQMRSWLAIVAPEAFPGLTPETDPIRRLDEIAATSAANARKGLAMAINDIADGAGDWTGDRIAAIDNLLAEQGLPTLSDIRATFSREVRRVIRQGRIANEVEYYALRNAVELPGADSERMWQLLEAYEDEQAK